MRFFLCLALLFMGAFVWQVRAANAIISPVSDYTVSLINKKPTVSFGDLLGAVPDTDVTRVLDGEVASPTPTLRPTQNPIQPVAGTPAQKPISKKQITISLIGDSMIDTLGPDGGGLAKRLQRTYPSTTFTVINHGVGAENIDSGLNRLTNGYSYLGNGRPSVLSEKPDIIVIESFGYNPYPLPDMTDALNKHWSTLGAMVDTIQKDSPSTAIVIAATIAPNWDVFGDGAPFVDFSPEGKRTKVEEIKKYIEGAIGFAKNQKLPLANAFHPTLDGNGNGKLSFINPGDHIHYSESGRAFMAEKIAQAITSSRILE